MRARFRPDTRLQGRCHRLSLRFKGIQSVRQFAESSVRPEVGTTRWLRAVPTMERPATGAENLFELAPLRHDLPGSPFGYVVPGGHLQRAPFTGGEGYQNYISARRLKTPAGYRLRLYFSTNHRRPPTAAHSGNGAIPEAIFTPPLLRVVPPLKGPPPSDRRRLRPA